MRIVDPLPTAPVGRAASGRRLPEVMLPKELSSRHGGLRAKGGAR